MIHTQTFYGVCAFWTREWVRNQLKLPAPTQSKTGQIHDHCQCCCWTGFQNFYGYSHHYDDLVHYPLALVTDGSNTSGYLTLPIVTSNLTTKKANQNFSSTFFLRVSKTLHFSSSDDQSLALSSGLSFGLTFPVCFEWVPCKIQVQVGWQNSGLRIMKIAMAVLWLWLWPCVTLP